MNIVIIFAGGTGKRMNTSGKPKQFLELHGKPILVYTIEQFQQHKLIDGIIVVMLESWIGYCEEIIERYHLTKVVSVVQGGNNGQESIFRGLQKAYELYPPDSIVLIHDGVRPLIDQKTISEDITCVEKHGTAITVAPAIETIALKSETGAVGDIFDRSRCQLSKAPQCFRLEDIYASHLRSQQEGKLDFIDSASLMKYCGYELYTVEGPSENIKITTPGDFYMFRAIVDARENSQIFGL